jgi:hypothetical protein
VPHALLRQEVELRITRYTIEVLAKGKRVASHREGAIPGAGGADH